MNITVSPVTTPADKLAFIKSQWNFYRGDANFVPPIIADRKKLLDTEKNPFYKHAEIQLFLAKRNGEAVGRIAAITNALHNEIHSDNIGFFGFFECENNPQTATALFAAAEDWLRKHGKTHIRGPVNPSMNDECGLLIDGFNEPPMVLTTYNPRYYASLISKAGFEKAKDLFAYILDNNDYINDKVRRIINALRERSQISIRSVNFKNKRQFNLDVATLKEIYNAAWQPNWGFVKMTNEEFDFLAADLKQVANPDYALILEISGKPAGFALAVPDINQTLIHNKNGSLLGALWHLLTKRKHINQVRIIVLGMLPEYQRSGGDAALYFEIGERGFKNGNQRGEASWILEDNVMMNRALQQTMKGTVYKTYRIYEKPL
ncbi:GNAT family N-acetyltransferase [Ignavibacteria bacterium]|nr:hypothetical protein [Bacteroidota bacterium]MCZ2131619.1 hypothetical protein [Bacteroidota bacterium]